MDPGPPQPTPINIRLVQDMPDMNIGDGGPPPPPPPQELSTKRDGFYKYWDRFLAEKPSGRPSKPVPANKPKGQTTIASIDRDVEGNPSHLLRRNTQGEVTTQKAISSYEEAAATCRAKVRAIVNECTRLNVKYTDRNFLLPYQDALNSLDQPFPSSMDGLSGIGSVKRVEDIYEKPAFIVDGATANDVRQGSVGDCWFLAAITALSGKKDLIERICVDRDEKVGVYGFVFFRDGEWISEIVDDKLALRRADDDRQFPTEFFLSVLGNTDVRSQGITKEMQQGIHYNISKLSKEYRESLRKGSNSLYFASCRESNETWLPLLEKAYAKVHGDYQAISGGFAGEGIEDLTGGVSTYITSESVLDKDKLWSELLQVNETSGFLFGCGSKTGRDSDPTDEDGFVRGHAYTVLDAREIDDPKNKDEKLRLLKIRNPWGDTEWNGAWSDGSKEWTADTLKELEHTFGDDGIFWISFKDWLKNFPDFERTRLFGPEWTIAQQWASVNVPWNTEYLDTKFEISFDQPGPVVLVLSQPDHRYFSGLRGRHRHSLHFRLYKEGDETYLVRSLLETGSGRSCSAELDLEPGKYKVFVKIETWRYDFDSTAEEIIKKYRSDRRDKLIAVGKSFDLSHCKGQLREREEQNLKETRDAQRKEVKDEEKRVRIANRQARLRAKARNRRIEAEKKRKREIRKAEILKEREEAKAKKAAAKAEKEKKRAATESAGGATGSEGTSAAQPEDVGGAGEVSGTSTTDAIKPEIEGSGESTSEEVKATSTTGGDSAAVADDANKAEPAALAATAEFEAVKGKAEPSVQDLPSQAKTVEEPIATESSAEPTPDSSKASNDGVVAEQAKEAKEETPAEVIAEAAKEIADAAEKIVEAAIGATESQAEPEQTGEEEENEEDDIADEDVNISDVDDDDFDWDSDIDGEADIDTEDDDEPGMYAKDPWNATAVIGLRIYSHCKNAKIRVVEHAERPAIGVRQVSKY